MTITEKYHNENLYYQFKKFNDIDNVNHLFTSRIGWNKENLQSNISDIFHISIDRIVSVNQVHGTNIKIVDSELINSKMALSLEVDGLITDIPNVVLTTYHADCVPIYFLDIAKKIIGIAHGGWRGTFDNISGKMIDTMKNKYDSNTKDILVGIGPSIGPCCYEVGKDLGEKFSERYNRFHDIIIRNGKIFLDLWKINYLQIEEKGIPKENIILSNICTSCEIDKFYSYRKEKGTNNRMVAAIGLVEDFNDKII
ncbi:peptidoglycan editing factor PgeF [Clostridium sp. Cult2]|uniref:peptidoglycan editing factor PgeF n=1 Tax=Clostridium sp. Cult2 TaxID=2079003 RepID=UPI001F1DDB16|nr:peptidoglycan editing factor PgeF [Clostridium sp. Cult2]MCF6465180.1 peptidoglycan editing factor PgeF [Clostridium sp. Cult2]